MTTNEETTAPAQAFTLIELLGVLAILGILMSIGFVAMRSSRQRAKVTQTTARMTALETQIIAYVGKAGDYPPTSLDSPSLKIKTTNDLNSGIEACVAALHHKQYPQLGSIEEKALGNTDDDDTTTVFHKSGTAKLLEVIDGWGNPIAYFHNLGYGKRQEYQMGADAPIPNQNVEARLSAKTGVYAMADSYQLISAGPDQEFGTGDDVTNFD